MFKRSTMGCLFFYISHNLLTSNKRKIILLYENKTWFVCFFQAFSLVFINFKSLMWIYLKLTHKMEMSKAQYKKDWTYLEKKEKKTLDT